MEKLEIRSVSLANTSIPACCVYLFWKAESWVKWSCFPVVLWFIAYQIWQDEWFWYLGTCGCTSGWQRTRTLGRRQVWAARWARCLRWGWMESWCPGAASAGSATGISNAGLLFPFLLRICVTSVGWCPLHLSSVGGNSLKNPNRALESLLFS